VDADGAAMPTPAGNGRSSTSAPPAWLLRTSFLAVLFTTIPTVLGVRLALPVGPVAVSPGDIALPLAGVALMPYAARAPWARTIIGALVSLIALYAFVGLLAGPDLGWVARDLRPYVYLLMGALVGLGLGTRPDQWSWCFDALTAYLVVVAGLVVASQVTPQELVGVGNAELYYGASSLDYVELESRRAQIETNALAQFAMCGVLGLWLAGGTLQRIVSRRSVYLLAGASTLVVFLSFSRNSVISVAVVVAVAPFVGLFMGGLNRWLRAVTLATGGVIATIALALAFSHLGWFQGQIGTFTERVIAGVSSESLTRDNSARWRVTENEFAVAAIKEAPVLGSGAGVFYRPGLVVEPFEDASGRLYVHNYPLWVLVKVGVIGFAIVAFLMILALRRLLRRSESGRIPPEVRAFLGLGFVGILAASLVAPYLGEPDFAAVAGLVLGAGMTVVGTSSRRATDGDQAVLLRGRGASPDGTSSSWNPEALGAP
jgi:O-antigen ligase